MIIDEYDLSTEDGDEAMPFAPLANHDRAGLVTGLRDYDGTELPDNGELPLPVYAKRVRDIYNREWSFAELAGEDWQAATVAKTNLPDGTPLFLKLRTGRNGDTLIFELATSEYYTTY
jgi:hypothetical protein